MATLEGNYQHERNENLDEYFKAIGMYNNILHNFFFICKSIDK